MPELTTKTKLDQLVPIDACWMVEHNYARHAQAVLAQIDASAGVGASYDDDRPYDLDGDIALINVSGPMTKKTTSASLFFGGCSTVRVRRAIRHAVSDSAVKTILLVCDSPGGQASGTAELADEVRKAASQKEVVAFVDGMCASAAYWVASQASRIVAGRASWIGSIGCFAVVCDYSEMFSEAGVKVHLITTGAYKGAGARGTKVTDEQIEDFQRECDEIAAQFYDDVAAGRSMPKKKLAGLADGRVWLSRDAREHGLIDQVAEFDDLINDLRSGNAVPAAHGANAMSKNPENTEGAGITGAPTEQPTAQAQPVPTPPPVVNADANALAAAQAQIDSMADQFGANFAHEQAMRQLNAEKATSADVKALEALYLTAFKHDGGGKVKLTDDGKHVVTGPMTEAVDAYFAAVPSRSLTGQVIPNATGQQMIVTSTSADDAKAEERRRYHGASPKTAKLAEAGN